MKLTHNNRQNSADRNSCFICFSRMTVIYKLYQTFVYYIMHNYVQKE